LGLLSTALGQWHRLIDNPHRFPDLPYDGPQANAPYMVDNQNNYFKTAPDKGKQNGAVWLESGSFENFMASSVSQSNGTLPRFRNGTSTNSSVIATDYWLPQLAPLGKQPIAGSNYKFYRDVVKDYKADNTGATDTTEALNAAIEDGDRCGLECGNTFSQGAIIYFPPGTYKICRPVIQLYYTQFIGDPFDPPVIKGCDEFQGIALFDTDPYIPNGNGQNWYINQNQFFRQIRNFIFDLTEMPAATDDNDQPLVPTGLHWQVSQACSLQNLVFNMPKATDDGNVTHVGIFMENGSGGFVSDLEFNGGNIGWRAGSQQYTAMNLKFRDCLTAVQMVWDWGFNWQRIDIQGGAIGFNISGRGGDTGQGIGSVSIIDSKIVDCPIAVLTNSRTDGAPNIVIDNLDLSNVDTTVVDEDGKVILDGTSHVDLWAIGRRYNGGKGEYTSGAVTAPAKGKRLLDSSGKLFYRPRPQYEKLGVGDFLVATDNGCKNDGTGDNTDAINTFLQRAKSESKVAYFPAGIYRVGGTVLIPTGSRVQGSSWSQIQGGGLYFSDVFNPRVVVQVGNKGDVGTMEIVDMMFNVQGATAGAIVLEWNVHESSQGSAAMWDSHVRVGGATGSDLDLAECPKFAFNDNCICASLLFHVTPQASGYFENIWIWLADHDNDHSVYDSPDKVSNQISIYAARGTLIESEGPSWFYGTGSEHTVLYQYQVYGAKDIYLGHIQTETPYYQPVPVAPFPFDAGKKFPGDPTFDHCKTEGCKEAWGLRIINSEGVTIHGAGMYSFFQEYYQDCIETHNCQERICEVKGSKDVTIFNIFTVAIEEIANGVNGDVIRQDDSNQSGYTTEVSVWRPQDGDDELNIVYVGPEVFSEPAVTCKPPCVLVFPTSSLSSPTVIDPGYYTTSIEYGHADTITRGGIVVTSFFTTTTTITVDIPQITVTGMPFSNYNVTSDKTSDSIVMQQSVSIPPVPVPVSDGNGGTTTRTLILPPWPAVTRGPPDGPGWGNTPNPEESGTPSGVFRTPVVTTISVTAATVTTITFPQTVSPITLACPPQSVLSFNTPRTVITTDCATPTTWVAGFTCPATKIITFLGPSTGVFTADCTLATSFTPPPSAEPTTTPPVSAPTTTDPLPVWTTWPDAVITPVTDNVDKPKPSDGGYVTPCKLWFFWFCVSGDDDDDGIGGWLWFFPPGIYPPGPPPRLDIRPWTIKGTLPPWPKITVGPNGQLTYSQEPTSCKTETASACSTTTFVTQTVTNGATRTGESTRTRCETIYGCSVTDDESEMTSTTRIECPLPTPVSNANDQRRDLSARQIEQPPPGCPRDAIVFPADNRNRGQIPTLLQAYAGKYTEVEDDGFVSLWFVPLLDQGTMDKLNESPDVASAYYPGNYNFKNSESTEEAYVKDNVLISGEAIRPLEKHDHLQKINETAVEPLPLQVLDKRAKVDSPSKYWPPSQVSLPKGKIWPDPDLTLAGNNMLNFQYDDIAGTGQYVYLLNEEGIWSNHDEFTQTQGSITTLPVSKQLAPRTVSMNPSHGSGCASKILGAQLGTCKKCNLVLVERQFAEGDPNAVGRSHAAMIQQLVDVLKDIKKGKVGKAVVSMSFGYPPVAANNAWFHRLHLNNLITQGKAVLVVSSGNDGKTIPETDKYPARFGGPGQYAELASLINVGATDEDTYKGAITQTSPWIGTFAPAIDAWVPGDPAQGGTAAFRKASGTSYAAPQVAGLAAYLRSLPTKWQTQLEEPRNVKKMIRLLHRRFAVKNPQYGWPLDRSRLKPIIWNGQVGDKNCLIDYDTKSEWDTDNACPDINADLDQEQSDGEPTDDCTSPNPREQSPGLAIERRQNGGSCPIVPGAGNGGSGGGGSGGGQTVTFTSGAEPKPTCASGTGCGGQLCTGYWCNPSPTGAPPDYHDPKDPNAGNPVPTTS
ncbi:pectin lyase-like protein, partial [Colletotrichum sublineola]